ncbi:hypothetical protein, partial [Staphylococcus aureus]|uniref:hypothetical protein n=1 Tax=Staphylococcus aureus TaxID=1280 RepID=UPI00123E57B0
MVDSGDGDCSSAIDHSDCSRSRSSNFWTLPVVVRTPDSDVTGEELKQFCLDNLAEYKHPREVEFV